MATTSAIDADDPWDWDILRVVQEFCTEKRSWPLRSRNAMLPDAAILEKVIRQEGLDGATLLTDVDGDFINTEFGPLNINQKSTMKHAIKELRLMSLQYNINATRHGPGPDFQTSDQRFREFPQGGSISSFSPFLQSKPDTSQRPSVEPMQICENLKTELLSVGSVPSEVETSAEEELGRLHQGETWVTDAFGKKRRRLVLGGNDLNTEDPEHPKGHYAGGLASTTTETRANNVDTNGAVNASHIIESEVVSGKKRKRLAPTLITSEIDPSRAREIPTHADTVIFNDPQTIEPGVIFRDNDGRKRMILVSTAGSNSDWAERLEARTQTVIANVMQQNGQNVTVRKPIAQHNMAARILEPFSLGYLGKQKFPVDEVFYSTTRLGNELSGDADGDSNFANSNLGEISRGRQLYVHNRMKHFLTTKRHIFRRNKEVYSAICPYPPKLTPMHHSPSFTLLHTTKDGKQSATREDLSKWPELYEETSKTLAKKVDTDDDRRAYFNLPENMALGGPSSYDNWDPDILLQKYQHIDGGDEVLPLFGDSDEDGEYDIETWREIEEERGTQEQLLVPLKRKILSPQDVEMAIDEGVAQIVSKWHKEKLPKRQRGAWSLWARAKKKHTRKIQIRETQQHLDRINNERLPKMREEILKQPWTSQRHVRKQSYIMEQSIFDREDLKWQMSVLENKSAPEKPSIVPRVISTRKSSLSVDKVDPEEGESVESESESEDDLDHFIVSDEGESSTETDVEEDDDEISVSDGELHNPGGEGVPHNKRNHINQDGKKFKIAIPTSINEGKTISTTTRSLSLSDHDEKMQGIIDEEHGSLSVVERRSSSDLSPPPPSSPLSSLKDLDKKDTSPMSAVTLKTFRIGTNNLVDLTITTSDSSPDEDSTSYQSEVDLVTPEKAKSERSDDTPGHPVKRKPKIKLVLKEEDVHNHEMEAICISDDGAEPQIPTEFPPFSDLEAISKYQPFVWERAGDRDRLILGIIHRMEESRRVELLEVFTIRSEDDLWDTLVEVMHACEKGENKARGIEIQTFVSLTGIVRLFEMYVDCRRYGRRNSLSSTAVHKMKRSRQLFSTFYQVCSTLLHNNDEEVSKHFEDTDSDDNEPLSAIRRRAKAITSNGSDNEELERDTPHKTRKRKVFENSEARNLRAQDQLRLQAQDERRRVLLHKIANSGSTFNSDRKTIIINVGKFDHEGFVFVNEEIGARIKPHQVNGVRFMWSQVVSKAGPRQGCLLAHTMGLGKTMQVITLLVAIAEAANSRDDTVSSQIPEDLKICRTLILCPPTLIDNWMDELLLWAPVKLLGDFRKVDSSVKDIGSRLNIIKDWYTDNGVLIMGYEMFRNYVQNKATAHRESPLDEEEHEELMKHLLEGPNLIIADEAHKMKNAAASITSSASRFRSKGRIALTGSPLANNVEEYHTMIDWVAPNYLGPIVEFRAKYVEPIQQGVYRDSSAYERRKSLKMLGVLKEDLAPKVHRADMAVLRNDLKPKTEFVIYVPLTILQTKAYTIYVRSMIGAHGNEVKQATLWHWLAILSLLCNHPECFRTKLTERKSDAQAEIHSRAKASGDTAPEEEPLPIAPVWKVGVSEELIRQEMELFDSYGTNIEDIDNSTKVKVLVQILDASRAVGDKVLVFTQSIPTLDYLEKLCKRTGRKYARLDGKTKMDKRQGLTKEFNTGRTDVYLISTTAGGLGLNLPGANRVVIFDFKFNPIMEEQAVGRAYRIGQQKPVFVYRFVCGGTFEDSVHNKAVFKMQLASRVVDKKNPVAWAKRKTGDFLFEPKPVEQQDLSSFKGMDPQVLDKILDMQGQDSIIRNIVMTDTFNRHDDDDVLTPDELREVQDLLSEEKLKRSNPAAWNELLAKRQRAAYEESAKRAAAANAQFASRINAANGNRTNPATLSTNPATAHPLATQDQPILAPPRPSSQSHMSLSHTSALEAARILSASATSSASPEHSMPELMPIAGSNTHIRRSVSPDISTSVERPRAGGHAKPVTHADNRVQANGEPVSTPPASLSNLDSTTTEKLGSTPVSMLSRFRSSIFRKKTTPDTPLAAEKRLMVGLKKGSIQGNHLFQDDKDAIIEAVALSIREEVERKTRDDTSKLTTITLNIAHLLEQDPELCDDLFSKKRTAKDVLNLALVNSKDSKFSSFKTLREDDGEATSSTSTNPLASSIPVKSGSNEVAEESMTSTPKPPSSSSGSLRDASTTLTPSSSQKKKLPKWAMSNIEQAQNRRNP